MINNLPLHIYIFAAILGLLALDFLFRFIFPAVRVNRELSRAIRQVKALGPSAGTTGLAEIFAQAGILLPLWREYAGSLHRQTETDTTGRETVCFRSTAPAETIFRPEVIVDIPLCAGFFRHLPGIFTGVGIIGTFTGLLTGLGAFHISENPIIVRDSLGHLLHGVSMAFVVSAAAITLAMCVTFIEKGILSRLHARVEELIRLLDDLFSPGVGEEYLARLVKASEFSARQAAPMQTALVEAMRQIMAEQAEKQTAALEQLGSRISAGIEESLRVPMAGITQAVQQITAEQGTAVHTMMHDLLSRFNENLRDLLGTEAGHIHEAQQETLRSLRETLTRMESIADHVESAGIRGADAMSEKLATAMTGAEARQQAINDRMGAFVETLSSALSRSQDAAQERLQHTLDDIANHMAGVIQSMSGQIQAASESGRQHQVEIAKEGRRVVGEFGEQVDLLTNSVVQAVDQMKMAVNAMRQITGETVSRLNAGADVLYAASSAFAASGREMTETLGKTSGLVAEFGQISATITGISGELASVLADYQAARETMTVFLTSLQTTVETSRRESALTGDVLALIEQAADKLVNARHAADSYLARISAVIEEAHSTFTTGMAQAVGEANHDFQQSLAHSITLLRTGVQELAATLEELGALRQTLPAPILPGSTNR
ncbi:MAG: hypothetical protein NC112_06185 [Oxalobacter formigenes]|nr:hypothetical protein [Oxalobacter formigenes]